MLSIVIHPMDARCWGRVKVSVGLRSIISTGVLTRNLRLPRALFSYWQDSVDLPEGQLRLARHSRRPADLDSSGCTPSGVHIQLQWLSK